MSTLNKKKLEDLLWGAAEYLRGQIDASDYKQYIFPLLFYKRLSDVYLEEYNEALHIHEGDAEYAVMPMFHRFNIPTEARWEVVRNSTKNIGEAIQTALRLIESSNERLHGVFGDAQWTNKERLPDHLLADLIQHFSKIPLGINTVDQDDLGEAYEFLIKKFVNKLIRRLRFLSVVLIACSVSVLRELGLLLPDRSCFPVIRKTHACWIDMMPI
jgi:type I restriction enzyme M protein